MQIMPVLSIIISLISVLISGLIYMNSKKSVENTNVALSNAKEALKQSQDKYLYELRLNALKSTKIVEAIWQNAINDVYHEKERIRGFEDNVSLSIKEMFNDYESELLKPSFENINDMRKKLEEQFDEITEEDAKLIIRKMDTMNITLKQAQEESIKKFELLYNKLKEAQK